ncbi:hypothetical protein DPMN_157969 [Dreissena polymorpha]|uniref:Uncharacterized protein n=1 Tax=Dreissena polymorpha TaxID=45954 RepID=A0A9D4EGF9_DREPO|nr:hypothetical protein DPMN_157969 [Dreissena polymorpha]
MLLRIIGIEDTYKELDDFFRETTGFGLDDDTSFLDEEFDDIGEVPQPKRFKEVSSIDITKIKKQNTEKTTNKQTKWAVNMLKGNEINTQHPFSRPISLMKDRDPGSRHTMDPGFKPVSYHLSGKGRIPVANLTSDGCSGTSAGLSTSHSGARPPNRDPLRRSLTEKVLRLELKSKDPSFKNGAIRPGFETGISRLCG